MQRGDPIEERYKEHVERGPTIDQLTYCVNSYRDAAMSKDPKFDHIDISEKEKVNICLGVFLLNFVFLDSIVCRLI